MKGTTRPNRDRKLQQTTFDKEMEIPVECWGTVGEKLRNEERRRWCRDGALHYIVSAVKNLAEMQKANIKKAKKTKDSTEALGYSIAASTANEIAGYLLKDAEGMMQRNPFVVGEKKRRRGSD